MTQSNSANAPTQLQRFLLLCQLCFIQSTSSPFQSVLLRSTHHCSVLCSTSRTRRSSSSSSFFLLTVIPRVDQRTTYKLGKFKALIICAFLINATLLNTAHLICSGQRCSVQLAALLEALHRTTHLHIYLSTSLLCAPQTSKLGICSVGSSIF